MSERLILAGFMGTGKTTVGQLCAEQLGYDFVDADLEIERREDMPIPRIFEQKGETYFRQLETALVQELLQHPRAVIATGGGMIVNEANRRALLGSGVCVCLTASPEAILSRVDAGTRPMLRGGDVRDRIAALLKERAPAYGELHYCVDTTSNSPADVVERVLSIYGAERTRIPVYHPGGHYDIVMGENILDQLGFALAGRGWSAPFAIVSDEHVAPLHGERLRRALQCAGIDSFIYSMPAGETHKHLQTVEGMYRAFSEHGLERSGVVIAVGGGVVGDVTGFAAATYLRGVSFVQVPTSLLAMADSSIGGKVGVDTSFGKNLVGAFKQPEFVAIDTSCLRTLPLVELRCGYAEIVKAALIAGGDAYARVRRGVDLTHVSGATDEGLIATLLDAIHLKRAVVEEDPYEKGRRALLNLGHTFGHGIEAWSNFTIKHGEAVALGMVCAARLSQAMAFCDDDLVREIIALLADAGLPTAVPHVDVEAVWQLMQSDKKKRSGKLNFVLLHTQGDIFVTHAASENQIKQALAALSQQ